MRRLSPYIHARVTRLLIAHVVASYAWASCFAIALAPWLVQRLRETDHPLTTVLAVIIVFLLAPLFVPLALIGAPIRAVIRGVWPLPMYYVGLAAYVVIGAVVTRRLALVSERMRREHFGLCPNCGYDLRASLEKCPECGAIPSPASSGNRRAGGET